MEQRYVTWDPAVPYPSAPARPRGMEAGVVHRADARYPFLHDTVITAYQNRLLMAWYNCSEDEIVGETVIRGRWSEDGGDTWSEPEVIAQDNGGGRHFVPVTFLERDGSLHAFTTIMSAHDRPLGYLHSVYREGGWDPLEELGDLVLFNTLPLPRPEGGWIAGGRMARSPGELPLIPVTATLGPADSSWSIQPLPGPWDKGENSPLPYPETAILPGKDRTLALVRNDNGSPWVYACGDSGWEGPWAAGLPCAPSKLYAGALEDGREYLLYNQRTEAGDRSKLVIALRAPGAEHFTSLYLLADGFDSGLDCGPNWHYPCACQRGDTLYISCTASGKGPVRHGALFRVPVASL